MASSNAASAAGERAGRLSREILALSAIVVLGTIMTVLDLTIVNVAIPTLGARLGAPIPAIGWVLTSYMLAFAAVIPLTGWATERFGAKRVWLAALGLFLAGSILAAAAWSASSLIAFRALQGLGAGMILPVGQTILAQAAGPERMGRVMSVIGVPLLLAPVFGPVLGGAILGVASWRWIFLINVPVGAAAAAAAWRRLPDARPRLGQRLDVRGLILLCPGIALFLYGMSEAGSHGGLGGLGAPGASLAGLAAIALFFVHARARGASALIDVTLLRRRGFAAAVALNLLLTIALFGSLILIPLYYQLVRHDSAVSIGLLLGPQGIGAAIALSVTGPLTDKIGARIVCTAGMATAGLGVLACTQVGARTSYAYLAGALFVIGLGIGSTIAPSMAAAFQALSPEEMPRATSALNAAQRIGGAIGAAAFAIVLQRFISAGLPEHQGGAQAIPALAREAGSHAAPALAAAFGTTFWIAVALIGAALTPALLLPRPPRPGQVEDAPAADREEATAARRSPARS